MVAKTPPRPDRVHVGPFQFSIEFDVAKLRAASGLNTAGACRAESTEIFVAPDLNLMYERDTVLHETLHACLRTFGCALNLGEDEEERLVSTLAPILLAVLRENPDLIRYLTA